MSQTFEFYDERAKEAAAEAARAKLDNVRERALRSERTWRGLAEQARKVARDRAKADNERAERRAAEAEAERAELVMVRERAMRSAAAWRGMANRALQIEEERVKADEIRAERRAAELEAALPAETPTA
jgi:hypothetical protein